MGKDFLICPHTRKAIQKVNNASTNSPCTCLLQPIIGFWCSVWCWKVASCSCHVVSAEIAVAMVVPIENPAYCKVRGVVSFLQVDEILGYFAEEASSCMELFCCMAMHVHILPSRHKPCFMGNSIGTSSSILCTVWTWHHQTFTYFQNWWSTLLVNASQMMKTWSMLVE